MTSALLQPAVAHPVAVKTEIGARRTRAKQYYDRNLGGKTYMSQQPSASYEDDQPLGQALPTISAPMTPPPNQRQSAQQESKGPRQTQSPVPAYRLAAVKNYTTTTKGI